MNPEEDTYPADTEASSLPADTDVLAAGRSVPYSMLPDWVALSGISPAAQAVYWQLALHINHGRGDRVVFPSREHLAKRLGFAQARSVDRYLGELVRVGAIDKHTGRTATGMRTRNFYVLHMEPRSGYPGPRSLADLRTSARTRGPAEVEQQKDAAALIPKRAAPARSRSAPQRTSVVRHSAPPLSVGAHSNQNHQNQTKQNHHQRRAEQSSTQQAGEMALRESKEEVVEREAQTLLRSLPPPWTLSESAVQYATEWVVRALVVGWSIEQLRDELTRDLHGARNPSGVMISRLKKLPASPPAPAPAPRPARSPCARHPGAARRGDGECAGCWADRHTLNEP